ncbi:MAG: hypothetical protein Q9169_003570 [Polycauliona sp. 2 TL-2023]
MTSPQPHRRQSAHTASDNNNSRTTGPKRQKETVAQTDNTPRPESGHPPWPEMPTPSTHPTPYQIFQLHKAAPYKKGPFYELVKLYHPDRHGHCCNVPLVDSLPDHIKMQRYRLIVAAHDILSDPTKRRAYDCWGAGWSTHTDVGGAPSAGNPDVKTRWSGFHDNGSPAGNATWEDWEKWYRRGTPDHQSPIYCSNGEFISFVAFVVFLSAIWQASRVDGHQKRFNEQVEQVHNDASKSLHRRRSETRESSNDKAILRFFTLQGTNTYLVGTGPQRILIDTGEGKPSWSERLSAILSSERAVISDALLTHWHPDHVGGVKDLLKLCPDARIYKHHATDGQLSIEDGQKFTTQGAVLHAFHCPGHTTDHMAFVLEEEDAMFSGDNVLGHGTAVFEDLAVYMISLQRMHGRFSGRVYPGHGAIIDDGRRRITQYIGHRQQREREVLQALTEARKGARTGQHHDGVLHDDSNGGARTSMELVKIIYHDVPESLHEPAARGMKQVLHKLAKEEKVVPSADGQRWLVDETSNPVL